MFVQSLACAYQLTRLTGDRFLEAKYRPAAANAVQFLCALQFDPGRPLLGDSRLFELAPQSECEEPGDREEQWSEHEVAAGAIRVVPHDDRDRGEDHDESKEGLPSVFEQADQEGCGERAQKSSQRERDESAVPATNALTGAPNGNRRRARSTSVSATSRITATTSGDVGASASFRRTMISAAPPIAAATTSASNQKR